MERLQQINDKVTGLNSTTSIIIINVNHLNMPTKRDDKIRLKKQDLKQTKNKQDPFQIK